MLRLNINSDEVVVFTNKLEQMKKSALPVAVRGALNNAAFDVKQKTMPMESNVFEKRSPTFLKATSKVEPATGLEIRNMKAVVGFMPGPAQKEKGGATADLEQQERGGMIGHRSFIPLKSARVAGSPKRNVRAEYRMGYINSRMSVKTRSSIVDAADNEKGRSAKEKFIRSAIVAGGGGYLIGDKTTAKGNRVLFRINSVHKLRKATKTKAGKEYKAGSTVVNATPIYSVKGKRSVHVGATHFMEKASKTSGGRIERYFEEQARRQLEKLGAK